MLLQSAPSTLEIIMPRTLFRRQGKRIEIFACVDKGYATPPPSSHFLILGGLRLLAYTYAERLGRFVDVCFHFTKFIRKIFNVDLSLRDKLYH